MKPGFQWTDEADRELREMVSAGKTRRHMANYFGLNVAQIGGRVFRLGLTKPNGRRGQHRKAKEAAE